MTLQGFIKEALSYFPMEVDEIDRQLLVAISHDERTAYQLSSMTPGEGLKLAYKNVLKRVHKLREMGLIVQQITLGGYKHGAIKYRVSDKGLYYLILEGWMAKKGQILEYKHALIFKTLVDPFLEEATVEKCTFRLYSAVWSYIQTCCRIIRNMPYYGEYIEILNDDYLVIIISSLIRWSMKSFILKLSLLEAEYRNEGNVFNNPYDVEKTFELLANDKKFMKSLEKYHQEVTSGYSKLRKFSK